jgi:hypothetical protein
MASPAKGLETAEIPNWDQFNKLQTEGRLSSKAKFIDKTHDEIKEDVKYRSGVFNVTMMLAGTFAGVALGLAVYGYAAAMTFAVFGAGLAAIALGVLLWQHIAMCHDGLQTKTALMLGEGVAKAVLIGFVLAVVVIIVLASAKEGKGCGFCDGFCCGYILGSWSYKEPVYYAPPQPKNEEELRTQRNYIYRGDTVDLLPEKLQNPPPLNPDAPPAGAPPAYDAV